jgi:hypothetical protein
MEGYEVTTVDDAISRCNIVVTTTGEWTFPSGSWVADGVTLVGFVLRTLEYQMTNHFKDCFKDVDFRRGLNVRCTVLYCERPGGYTEKSIFADQ